MASPGASPSFEFNATYVHSLRQRDPATEEHFVSHFSPMLLRKLRKHLRSTELAHDLRQETFLRVLTFLRSNHSIREPERFVARKLRLGRGGGYIQRIHEPAGAAPAGAGLLQR